MIAEIVDYRTIRPINAKKYMNIYVYLLYFSFQGLGDEGRKADDTIVSSKVYRPMFRSKGHAQSNIH